MFRRRISGVDTEVLHILRPTLQAWCAAASQGSAGTARCRITGFVPSTTGRCVAGFAIDLRDVRTLPSSATFDTIDPI